LVGIVALVETERELSVKTLNELLWLFMRQAAVEGAGLRSAMRRPSPPEARSASRRLKGDKTS
jgi:hypothetical protein